MSNSLPLKILTIIIPAVLIIGLFLFTAKYFQPKPTLLNQPPVINIDPKPLKAEPKLALPLSAALERVAKKPFSLYVTPNNSPVKPEKFTGYHTGADFEITPGEENKEITVSAVCAGKILLKKLAAGYGGMAVQSCKLNSQEITIIYGHLKFSSISLKIGQTIAPGEKIGILGKGYSSETGGERKHLHLGIHQGSSINLLGYVQQKSQLSGWLNALDYLK